MSALAFLDNKNILILGLGATGLSFARFLAAKGFAFAVNDSRAHANSKPLAAIAPDAMVIKGAWDKALIHQADVILASPGVDINLPEIANNRKPGSLLIGDVELFARLTKAKLLAVTGSNGKSTVVTLLHHMAKACGIDAELAGNIGTPVLDTLDKTPEFVILELSSFQLETMSSMQAVAASVLNVSDDHLDRHKTLENYRAIKLGIYQQSEQAVISREQSDLIPEDNATISSSFGLDAPQNGHFGILEKEGERFLALGNEPLLACNELPIVGQHNELNTLAALALGYVANWPLQGMVRALTSFEGLEHRCKLVPTDDGITWVNDSKATNIGATLAAIDGLAQANRKLILIAGGDGKGADFNELSASFTAHVDELICFGKDGEAIARLKDNSVLVADLNMAVSQARELAHEGDLVLLSPACASLDMFDNYMQRGEEFITAVREGA